MKINLFILALVTLLIGCRGRNDPETIAKNQLSVNKPEFVADTKRGKLYRLMIETRAGYYDRIYYFENDNSSMSVNYEVKQGKSHITESISLLE